MHESTQTYNPLGLLWQWLLANGFGWAIGLALGMQLSRWLGRLSWVNEDRTLAFSTLLALGLALGVAQWLVLRQFLPRPERWMLVTLAGYLLGMLVFTGASLLRLGGEALWDDALLLALLGMVIGLAQYWLLRQHYQQAWLWVLASALGFLFFLFLVANPTSTNDEFVTRGAVAGTFGALLSGLALLWLSRPSRQALPA